MAEKPEKRTYTVKEVGEILGVSRYAVYHLLEKEEFRSIKVNKKSFDDWLDKGPSKGPSL